MNLENTNKAFSLIQQRKIILSFVTELKDDHLADAIIVNDTSLDARLGRDKEEIKKLIANLRSDILTRCQVAMDEIDNELVKL